MIPVRRFAPALLLAACGPPAPAVAPRDVGVPPVLFAVAVNQSGRARLDPIGFVAPDSLRTPPPGDTDSASNQFRREQLRPGRRHPLWIAGAAAGWATTVAEEEPGCLGLAAEARLDPAVPTPVGEWRALAGPLPRASRSAVRRAPTAAERAAIDTLAMRELSARGVPAAELASGEATVAAVRYPGLAPDVLVASWFLPVEGDSIGRSRALLLVAEPARGRYRRAWTWWNDGSEADVVRSDFLDALDVDGDGAPELVFHSQYYESWDYHLLARRAQGWVETYRGGGGGC